MLPMQTQENQSNPLKNNVDVREHIGYLARHRYVRMQETSGSSTHFFLSPVQNRTCELSLKTEGETQKGNDRYELRITGCN